MVELNVGGHLSLGGDPAATVATAREQGFDSMQIFASSPGAWKPPIVDPESTAEFRMAREEQGIAPLIIHAIYLINLASANPDLVARSKSSLRATLEAAAALGAAGVVTHIGSHAGRGFDAVASQIAGALVDILEATPEEVQLILENSAGAGGIIGADLGELGELLLRAGRPSRLSVAIDTAHLCGAGWNFQAEGTAARLVEEVEQHVSLDRLAVIHANDSLVPCGSRKDRHANIGEGHIGRDGFRHLVRQPELRRVPWILETPNLERRVEDLTTLKALAIEPLPAAVGSGGGDGA